MTITYTGEVATCRGFGCFLKLLLRWVKVLCTSPNIIYMLWQYSAKLLAALLIIDHWHTSENWMG